MLILAQRSDTKEYRPLRKLVVSLVDRVIQYGAFQSELLPQAVFGSVYQPQAPLHS
jgi:hypothetical protein